MPRVDAPVNPSLLVWAREDAGYSLAEAAKALGLREEQLAAWEAGVSKPTLRQAEKIAFLYQRTFSVLCLPAPPQTAPIATEYRRLPGVKPGQEPPGLRVALRRLIRRRHLALHLFAELGDEPTNYPLRAHLSEDVETVGARLREQLGLTVERQLEWPSEFVAFKELRARVERLGVIVSQIPGKDLSGIRGTSVIHFPLPVVGVNSREIPLSRPFTLLHEVVHLSLAAANEESPAADQQEESWLQIERFCEAVTGAILMPRDMIANDPTVLAGRDSGAWDVTGVRRSSRRFRVTPSAIVTRLLMLRIMSPSQYKAWMDHWSRYIDSHPEPKPFGRSTPSEKALTRSGPLFTSMVLSALQNDRITSADASQFLDVGYGHVVTLMKAWVHNASEFEAA